MSSNLILIDSKLKDTDILVSALNDNTIGIMYNYDTSRNDLLSQIETKFTDKTIQRIAICCHEGEMRFLENETFFILDNESIKNANTQFIIDLLIEYNVVNIDYLACSSLKYDSWKDYFDLIEDEVGSVTIGASEDETGNLKYGGNWIMEKTGEQIDTIYFNKGLEYYKHLLVGSEIEYVLLSGNGTHKKQYDDYYKNNNIYIKHLSVKGNVSEYGFFQTHTIESLKIRYDAYVYNHGFRDCYGLLRVDLQNTVISEMCFHNCYKLKTVVFSSSVRYIEKSAFQQTNIEELILTEGLIYIRDFAFNKCSNLKSIHLPSTLSSVDRYAFLNIPSPLKVTFKNKHDGNIYINQSRNIDGNIRNDIYNLIYSNMNNTSGWSLLVILEIFTINPSLVTLETNGTINMSFNTAISETDISNSLSVDPSNAGTIIDISNTTGNEWTATFVPNYDLSLSDCSLQFIDINEYINETINFNIDTFRVILGVIKYELTHYDLTYDMRKIILNIEFDTPLFNDVDILPYIKIYDSSDNQYTTSETSIIQFKAITSVVENFKWSGEISVPTYVEFDRMDNRIEFVYRENDLSLNVSEIFDIKTVIPRVTSVALDVSILDYNNTTGTLTIIFSTEIAETAQELIENNITIMPVSPDMIEISQLEKTINPTIWTATITALDNIYHKCSHIMVTYEGTMRQTQNFDIDTIIPELSRVDLDVDDINGFNYNRSFANIEFEFSREILEGSISIISYIEIDPSNMLVLNNLSQSEVNGKIWNGIISVSGELQYDGAFIKIDYLDNGNTFEFLDLKIDTISPLLLDISMSNKEINYNNSYREIEIEFSRELIETSNNLIEYNIKLEPINSLLITNLNKNANIWEALLSVPGEIDNSNGSIEVEYKGVVKKIENININTIVPELLFVELNIDNFTYATSTAIFTIGFTRDIIETVEELSSGITINANGKLQMTNLKQDEQNKLLWNADLIVIDEYFEPSCNITVIYKDKTITSSIFEIDTFNTINIQSIDLDVVNFTYNETSSKVKFIFSDNVPESVEDLSKLITIEPHNSLIMTDLEKDILGECSATLTVSGEIEYLNGYIQLDYVNSFKKVDINIDTYIPDVSAVYLDIPKFTYLETSSNLSIEFTREIIDDANFLLENSIVVEPQGYLQITYLQKDNGNPLKWNAILNVIGEVEIFNVKVTVSYQETSKSTGLFDIDTIVPDVVSINMDILDLNYYESTSISNFTIEFSRNVIDGSINLQNNHIVITPIDKLLMTNLHQQEDNPLLWNALISVSGELEYENGSIEVSYMGTSKTQNNININTIIPELLDITIDKSEFNYHDTSANITIKFTRTIVESVDILKASHITIYPEESLELTDLVQTFIDEESVSVWNGKLQIKNEIDELSGNIVINYRGVTKETPLLKIDSIVPDVLSLTIDNENFTYYDTSRNLTIEFSKNIIETREDLQNKFIIIDPSMTLIMTDLHQDVVNPLIWTALLSVNIEAYVANSSIKVEYKDTNKTIDIKIDTVIPILYFLEMNPLELTYDVPAQDINIYFTRNVIDSVEHFLTNYITIEPSSNLVLTRIEKSVEDNRIWNLNLSVSGEIEVGIGEFKINYNGIVKTLNFEIDTIIPTIEHMTIIPNRFIIDKETATNSISNDISNAFIEIKFERPIIDERINEFLTVRDKNLKLIPTTDISLSQFYTDDDGITWRGNMYILKYELYYFNGSLSIDYMTSYKSKSFDIDTVKTYTYSNKLVGPKNETMLSYYKPCYQIRRSKGKLYYVFDNNITNDSCSIFGINEKNFENTNTNTVIPIGYNSNFELYNNSLQKITSNGLINSGIGSIVSEAYNFRLTVGFITYTLSNVAYSDSLLSIIKEVLVIWSSMVNKPEESRFENINDYENYSLTISFIITDLEPSEENMTSEIVENYGTEFGSIFPTNSRIRIKKSYIQSKVIDNAITNSNYINSIKNLIKRSIGSALGIGHYWYLPTSPISYDVLNHKYYSGIYGTEKYIELFSSHVDFNGKLIGLPIEDYEDNSIFLEEGEDSLNSKNIRLNGLTHPGLDKEIMTRWIDFGSIIPISIVSLGLLEDIGYDVCYNNADEYMPVSVFRYDYEIYVEYDRLINTFLRLTDIYIQNKNKYYVNISINVTQIELDNLFSEYINNVINNSLSMPNNELVITAHNSNIIANWESFNDKNGSIVNILHNINNETHISQNETIVYKFTTIKQGDNKIIALLDIQINK